MTRTGQGISHLFHGLGRLTDLLFQRRDEALIKVTAGHDKRAEVLQIAEVFRARVVDVSPDALIFEITGTEDKIDSLVDVLRPFGIVGLARTGRVSMVRATSEAVSSLEGVS